MNVNLINGIDTYYQMQLNLAIDFHTNGQYAQVQFIRAELHTVNMFLFFVNYMDLHTFNALEVFVNDMLGGKKDVGIRYK